MPSHSQVGTSASEYLDIGAGGTRIATGAGDDTLVFYAGLLSKSRDYSTIDHVIDFDGAGAVGGDTLEFRGFSDGSQLVFDHYGSDRVWDAVAGKFALVENKHLQYYYVSDKVDPSKSGYVLVQTTGTARLTSNDYHFASSPKHEVLVDFEDISYSGYYVVPDGYKGFDWHVPSMGLWASTFPAGRGGYSLTSSEVAFNSNSGFPIDINRHDGSTFEFKSVDIAAAWNWEEKVTISGWLNGVKVGSQSVTIDDHHVLHFTADWGAIDDLRFDYVSGIHDPTYYDGHGNHLVLDNFLFAV